MASKFNTVAATSGDGVQLTNAVLQVWAQEVLLTAEPLLRFDQVAQVNTDLTTTPGETVTFLRYNPLTRGSALAESAKLETETMSTTTVGITVTEHGKAVQVTQKLKHMAQDALLDRAAMLLGRNYATERDNMLRTALLTSTQVLYGKGKADRANLLADSYMDVDAVRAMAELLATNKAPKFGDAYIAFIHPHQARYLRKDSDWQAAAQYNDPSLLLKGEIGRLEDIRFIQTTNITKIKVNTQDIWADGADTGVNTSVAANTVTDVYQAIFCGDYGLGLAESLPVSLREDDNTNFQRFQSLAWYDISGAGLIESSHVAILETA